MATTRGPLAPAVYWRRRLFVLGTLVALVMMVVNLVRGDEEPPAAAQATTVVRATDGRADAAGDECEVQPEEWPEGQAEQAADPDTRHAPPVPVLASPAGPCVDSDVVVTPYVAGAVAGRPVTVTLQLRTVESPACTWRVTANRLALKVSRAGEQVWASWQCQGQLGVQDVVVRRGVTTTVNVAWNARYSESGCSAGDAVRRRRRLNVSTAAFGGEPADADFSLAQPRSDSARRGWHQAYPTNLLDHLGHAAIVPGVHRVSTRSVAASFLSRGQLLDHR